MYTSILQTEMIRIEHSKYNTVSTQYNTVSKSQLVKLRVGPKQ